MPFRAVVPVLLVALSMADPALAQEEDRPLLTSRLDSLARAKAGEPDVAGLSVIVLQGADTLLHTGYGRAHLGLGVPATRNTRYRLVGPTYAFVAALIMQEVESGRLSLDQDAAETLPNFDWQGRSVTIRQLLDATSGLPDYHYLGDPYYEGRPVPRSRDQVTALFADRAFTHEPGECWQWTISGYHLAGVLLEETTGRSFGELLRTRIAEPLGLDHTVHCGDGEITSGLAHGYAAGGDGLVEAQPASPTTYPFVASICSSVGDVATFIRSLRDGRLLEPASYEAMSTLSPAAEAARQEQGWALGIGLAVMRPDGRPVVLSNGTLDFGFGSMALDFPDDALTVVVLTNTWGVVEKPADVLALDVAEIVLGVQIPRTEAPDPPPLRDEEIIEAERDRLLGT